MNRILWGMTGVFTVVALAAGIVVHSAQRTRAEREVEPKTWLHAFPEGDEYRDLPERFDLNATATFGEAASSALRIYLHATGEAGEAWRNAQFIELSRGGYALGRMEGGIAMTRHTGGWTPADVVTVGIRRREAELAIVVGGRLVALASDGTYSGGAIAIGSAGGATAKLGRLTRLPDLPEFSDDFMRTPEQPGPWETVKGAWVIDAMPTPSMSANGFSFRGAGNPALAVTGGGMWDSYGFSAAARGAGGGAMGLAFAVSPSGAHGLLRWTSREIGEDGAMPAGSGRSEIVYVDAEGREEALAFSEGGYIPDQWYRMEVELRTGRAIASVDGHELLAVEDDRFIAGGVGLYSAGERDASFDDVLVVPQRKTSARFLSEKPAPPGPYWETVGGRWSVGPEGLELVSLNGLPTAKLLAGSPKWRRYRVSAELGSGESAGIVAAYRDESNFITFSRLAGGRYEIERVKDGVREVLASAESPAKGAVTLDLLSDRGYLAGSIDGRRLLEAWDYDLLQGRLGVWSGAESSRFRSIAASLLPHEPPLNVVNPTFMQDSFMSSWASGEDEWYETAEGGRKIYWHHWPFRSDVELALDLPKEGVGEGVRIVLGISKSPDKPLNGYGWEIVRDPGLIARLWREDRVIEECPIEESQIDSIYIRRQGGFVSAGVDGRPVAQFIDPEPLEGGRVAYLMEGIHVPTARARLYGGLFNDYLFNRAPDEWRTAAGVWTMTSRWDCDPRWSFFSGQPKGWPEAWPEEDVHNRPVVVWNKRTFPGDVVLDFYVGPTMAARNSKLYRQFRRYEYARDFNVSLAADGADLASGYTFMFGGFNNTRSVIMRGTEVVAETADVNALMPRNMRIHQKWYRVRVQKTGGELRLLVDFIDRSPVRMVDLVYHDPSPMDGDRLAIWTYGCGITLARLRIASDSEGPMEPPDFQPPVKTRTIYDEPQEDSASEEGERQP